MIGKDNLKRGGGGAGGSGILKTKYTVGHTLNGTISNKACSGNFYFELNNDFYGTGDMNGNIKIYNASGTQVYTGQLGISSYTVMTKGVGDNKFIIGYTNSGQTQITLKTCLFNGTDNVSSVGEITRDIPRHNNYYLLMNYYNLGRVNYSSLDRIEYDATNNVIFGLVDTTNDTTYTAPLMTITLDSDKIATGISINGSGFTAGTGSVSGHESKGILKAYGNYYQVVEWWYSSTYYQQTIVKIVWDSNSGSYVFYPNIKFNTYSLDNGYTESRYEFVRGDDEYIILSAGNTQEHFVLLNENLVIQKNITGIKTSNTIRLYQTPIGKIADNVYAVLCSEGTSYNTYIYTINTSTNAISQKNISSWCNNGANRYGAGATKIVNGVFLISLKAGSYSDYCVGLIGITTDEYLLTGNKATTSQITQYYINDKAWVSLNNLFYPDNVSVVIVQVDKYNYQALKINVSGSGKCGILNGSTLTETTFSTSLVTSDTGVITKDGSYVTGIIQWWYKN